MEKTTFKLEIHATGTHLSEIAKMIGAHNSRKVNIDIDVLTGYMIAKKAASEPCWSDYNLFIKPEGDNGQTIHVSCDNGKTFYMTITEVEPAADFPIGALMERIKLQEKIPQTPIYVTPVRGESHD